MTAEFNLCPYLYTRFIQNKVNLLILPYNYVLNPKISKSIGLSFKNAVIVFDEAHNIENAAESCFSSEIDLETIRKAQN